MAGVVSMKWYATGFRGDDLEVALTQLAPLSLRSRATRYEVLRSRDDRYNFHVTFHFDEKSDWDAFWFGEEFTDMRASCSGWYQVPLLYVWNDLVATGETDFANGNGNDEAAQPSSSTSTSSAL